MERFVDAPWELFAAIFPWLFFGETRKYQIFFVESLVNIKYFLCWIRKWLIPCVCCLSGKARFQSPVLSRNWLSKLTGIIAKSYFLDQSSAMLILNQSGIIQGVGDIKYWARLLTILYLWQPRIQIFLKSHCDRFLFLAQSVSLLSTLICYPTISNQKGPISLVKSALSLSENVEFESDITSTLPPHYICPA